MTDSTQLPQKHKVAYVRKPGMPVQVSLEDVDVPSVQQLKPGQALVKLRVSGVCHSDLHIALGEMASPYQHAPLVGGHEGAGELVALGPELDGYPYDVKVGDRVGIKWTGDHCGRCAACEDGVEVHCGKVAMTGFTVQGTFQQYAVTAARALVRVPQNVDFADAAPIMCAGVTVYRALKASGARPGEWVAIPGAGGGLGHLAVQYAHAMGLKVIAIDTGADKKALCTETLKAEAWIDFRECGDLVKAVKSATPDGAGPAASIVAAAGAAAYQQALDYIRSRGTVVAVGLPKGATISVNILAFVSANKRLVSSYIGTRKDTEEALEIVAQGKVKPIQKVQPMSTLQSVYEEMEGGKVTGRVVLDLWK